MNGSFLTCVCLSFRPVANVQVSDLFYFLNSVTVPFALPAGYEVQMNFTDRLFDLGIKINFMVCIVNILKRFAYARVIAVRKKKKSIKTALAFSRRVRSEKLDALKSLPAAS